MSNPNKARGTKWESDVRNYLNRTLGQADDDGNVFNPADPHNVVRKAQEGSEDVGDLWALPFVLEAKSTKTINLAEFVDQAESEAVNARLPYGAAVIKRRGKGAARGYVVMTLATFAQVIKEMRAQCSHPK